MADNTIQIANFLENYVSVGKETNTLLGTLNEQLVEMINGQASQKAATDKATEESKKRETGLQKNNAELSSSFTSWKKVFEASLAGIKKVGIKTIDGIENLGTEFKEFGKSIREEGGQQTGLRSIGTKTEGLALGGIGSVLGGFSKTLKGITKFLGPLGKAAQVLLLVFDSFKSFAGLIAGGALAASFTALEDFGIWFDRTFKVSLNEWWRDTKEGWKIFSDTISTWWSDFSTDTSTWWSDTKDGWGVLTESVSKWNVEQKQGQEVLLLTMENFWDSFKISIKEWWFDTKKGWDALSLKVSNWFDSFTVSIKTWWFELKEGFNSYIIEFKTMIKDLVGSIRNVIESIPNPFSSWFGGKEEKSVEELAAELPPTITPEELATGPKGVISRNAPQSEIKFKLDDEAMKKYNDAVEENNKNTLELNQKFQLLINTIDKKDLGTKIINNTTHSNTNTPTFGSGNSVRK